MGRHKTHRNSKLYTRIRKENNTFLKRTHKAAGMSKAAWMDEHLDFLRMNFTPDKAAKLIAKAGDKIQKQA